MYKLPEGEFTLVIEFFCTGYGPGDIVVSTSLNIGQQSTKLFSKYSRSVIHLHKYDVTPPEYIYVDLKCQGIANSPAQGCGHLDIYGIEGKQNDVNSDVYDSPFYLENNKMTFKVAVEFDNNATFKDEIEFDKKATFDDKIDMNNNQIKNVQDGIESNDVANIKKLNEFESNLE